MRVTHFVFGLLALLSADQTAFAQSKVSEEDIFRPSPPERQIVVQSYPNPRVAYKESYALVISNSGYDGTIWPTLPESVHLEADRLKNALVDQGFTVFRLRNLTGLEIAQEIRTFLASQGKTTSRLMIYFTGHGWTDSAHLEGYILGIDAADPAVNPVRFREGAVGTEQLALLSRTSKALHSLFVFDACFSGAVFQTKSNITVSNLRLIDILRSGQQFITSASEYEKSPAVSQFTPAFIDGIRGKADLNRDGIVLASELALYLKDKITSSPTPTTPQYGDVFARGGDFLFLYDKIGGPLQPPTPAGSVSLFASLNVQYYRKAADGDGLLRALTSSNIPFITTRAALPQSYRSDGIACSPDTPVEAIKFLAKLMIKAGYPLKAITRTRDPKAKRTLQIISFAADARTVEDIPLDEEMVDQLASCPSLLVEGGRG